MIFIDLGKLPIAWLPGMHDPPRLATLRDEQSAVQREIWRRLVSRQRVGADVTQMDLDIQQDIVEQPTASRVRNFIDGMTSWMHLTLS